MVTFFAYVCFLAWFVSAIALVIWIIKKVTKKETKKSRIAFLSLLIGGFVSLVISFLSTPTIWCEHEYKLIEEKDASCTIDGEILYHCDLCDSDKTEIIEATGHKMISIKKTYPTKETSGKEVNKCDICGFEETKIIEYTTDKKEKSTAPQKSQIVSDQVTTQKESQIASVLTTKGYSYEQANKIDKILNELGINSIEIYAMTGTPQKGLNSVVCYPNSNKADNSRFNFTTENGELFYVGFLGEDLYDSEKGGIIKRYNEVHIPENEVDSNAEISLMIAAEDVIKKYLNYPATADFHTMSWRFARSDDKYSASGTVSAQNAFGVEDEMPFSVYFELVNGKLKIEKVSLDGTIVYEK